MDAKFNWYEVGSQMVQWISLRGGINLFVDLLEGIALAYSFSTKFAESL